MSTSSTTLSDAEWVTRTTAEGLATLVFLLLSQSRQYTDPFSADPMRWQARHYTALRKVASRAREQTTLLSA